MWERGTLAWDTGNEDCCARFTEWRAKGARHGCRAKKAGYPVSYFSERSGEAARNRFWEKITKFR
jgi:hypothetical protein